MHIIGYVTPSPRCCCSLQDSTVLYIAFEPSRLWKLGVALLTPNANFPVHLLLGEATSELASQSPSPELVICVLWSCMTHSHNFDGVPVKEVSKKERHHTPHTGHQPLMQGAMATMETPEKHDSLRSSWQDVQQMPDQADAAQGSEPEKKQEDSGTNDSPVKLPGPPAGPLFSPACNTVPIRLLHVTTRT